MNACGRPAIAFAAGGALETVIDGRTGVLVGEQTPAAFADAMQRFEQTDFDPAVMRAHAEPYNLPRFIASLQSLVADAFEEFSVR